MNDEAAIAWEAIYTVHDYWDGPRGGIANYRGVAHAYRCEWDDAADDWGRLFRLSPIDDEQLSAVMEDWSIWRRYEARFHAGTLLPDDKHPALAVDWPRHQQLSTIVEAALEVNEAVAVRAIPEFRGGIEPTHDWEVSWFPAGR